MKIDVDQMSSKEIWFLEIAKNIDTMYKMRRILDIESFHDVSILIYYVR